VHRGESTISAGVTFDLGERFRQFFSCPPQDPPWPAGLRRPTPGRAIQLCRAPEQMSARNHFHMRFRQRRSAEQAAWILRLTVQLRLASKFAMTKISVKHAMIIGLGAIVAAALALCDNHREPAPTRHATNSAYTWTQSGTDTPDPKGWGMHGCFFSMDAPVHAKFCISEM
jgi:hypothetical protein